VVGIGQGLRGYAAPQYAPKALLAVKWEAGHPGVACSGGQISA
jgi:hypothetical protein